MSITSKAALSQILVKKKGTALFALPQLTMSDRKAIVQKGLDTFGKKLSDSAFNNQVLLICFALRPPTFGHHTSFFNLNYVVSVSHPAPDTDHEEGSSESSLPAPGLRRPEELCLL